MHKWITQPSNETLQVGTGDAVLTFLLPIGSAFNPSGNHHEFRKFSQYIQQF